MPVSAQTRSKGCLPEGLPFVLVLAKAGIDGEAVGELGTIVGEDGVNRIREMRQEAFQEAGGGPGVAAGMDLDIDRSGCPVDGDEHIGFAALQRRQMLQINPRLRGDKRG